MPIVSPADLSEPYDLRAALESHWTRRATALVSDAVALSERDISATSAAMADHIEAVKQRALVDLETASMVGATTEES